MSDPWPIEDIPASDRLYMRVHRQYIRPGRISGSCFKNHCDPIAKTTAMSTDWQKYSTPEECRARARSPRDNGVIDMLVGDVLEIRDQRVNHAPHQGRDDVSDDRAHTDVSGPKDPEIQLKFARICRLILDVEPVDA